MIQLVYISAATAPMSKQDLKDLLQYCRQHNPQIGVTGMLFYGNGTFLQVLEGEEQVIDELLDTIEQDPRHTGLQVIQRKAITEREYADWSMGFQQVSERALRAAASAELDDFHEGDFKTGYLREHRIVVQSLMDHFRKQRIKAAGQSELGVDEEDAMINVLHRIIRLSVRALAIMMVITIVWGVLEVGYALYSQLLAPAVTDLRINDIVVIFGAFLSVLIAIEIFVNITLYLRDDVVHVKLVIATALMAIARKVIVFDFEKLTPMYILATAAVVLALGLVYWLMDRQTVIGARYQRPEA
ncbi:phosphate-starvation-inducible PsiE family protein [Thiorhodovibrio frisius]|uniref:Putative membrane protein n=1 Tax=Thiorhodovibrio frisius TaxID=631362 RepID=H8Z1A9_9GAMM|nr:phosphate-starvation-inducible PsiE family protein [Thiorhodovibrio frisius]EIC21424.1 putative membrane protein [Thiorhodovibrio frisius]WPL24010.1 putative membrane protein [Thiorhodovibrio frisius]